MSNMAQYLARAVESPFAQFLLDAMAKATALLAAAMVATALLRRSSAAVRHRIWCLTFAALVLLPGLSAALPEWRLAVLPYSSPLAPREESRSPLAPHAEPTLITAQDQPTEIVSAREDLPLPAVENDLARHPVPLAEQAGYVALRGKPDAPHIVRIDMTFLWLTGTLLALLPLIVGFVRTFIVRRRSQTIDDAHWTSLLDELRQRLALARRVGLYETASALMPMTWGVLRPVVMLPRQAHDWTDRLRRIVLLHELAHVKRCDVAYQLLGRLACALYWFHPLAWYALRRLRIERELACDDCVVLAGERATDYAAELVEIARSYRTIPFAAAIAMAQRSSLEHRLRAMFDRACSHLPISTRAARLLLAGALVIATTLSAVRLAPQASAEGDAPQDDSTAKQSAATKTKPFRITVRVVNQDGAAIAAARVRVLRVDSQETARNESGHVVAEGRANRDGTVSLDYDDAGPFAEQGQFISPGMVVIVEAKGYAFDWYRPTSAADETVVRLSRDDTPIEGRVLDLEGRPRAGVHVGIVAVERGTDEIDAWVTSATKNPAAVDPDFAAKPIRSRELERPSEVARFPSHDNVNFGDRALLGAVRTDETGRFRMEGLGRDRLVMLELSEGGIAKTWLNVVTRDMPAVPYPEYDPRFRVQACFGRSFSLTAEPEQPIEGVVRDNEGGQPLAGVEVRLAQYADARLTIEGFLSAVTDQRGHYSLRGVPKPHDVEGRHKLSVVPPPSLPYFRTNIPVGRQAGLGPITCDIQLKRARWLSGRITNAATGKPILGMVEYYPFLSNSSARDYPNFDPGTRSIEGDRYPTDDDGNYRLPVLPGRGIVAFIAKDRNRFSEADGADAIADLQGQDGGRLNVYHLDIAELVTAVREVSLPSDAIEDVCDINLRPLDVVNIKLVDAAGQAVVGAVTRRLTPSRFGPNYNWWSYDPLPSATAEIVGPADQSRAVMFLHRERKLAAVLSLPAGEDLPRQLVLRPCASVTGRIVDRAGKPIGKLNFELNAVPRPPPGHAAGPRRGLSELNHQLQRLATGDDGRFHVGLVPPGVAYVVWARLGGDRLETTTPVIEPGESLNLGDLVLQLPNGDGQDKATSVDQPMPDRVKHSIHGRVIDLEGRAVVGARVQVTDNWEPKAEGGKLDDWLADVRAAHDKTDFQAAEYKHLRKLPRDTAADGQASVVTDGEGRFQIDAGGEERVVQLRIENERIESLFCRAVTRPIETLRVPAHIREVGEGLVNPEDDIVVYGSTFDYATAPGCRVEGVVRDEQTGQPLPNITVQAQHGLQPLASATTDAGGHYILTGISAGAKAAQVVALAAADVPYIAKTLNAMLQRPGDRATVDFGLGRGVWIEGQVIDKRTGRGVEATVEYYAWRDNRYLERVGAWGVPRWENVRRYTDEDGKFRLLGLPGIGLVSAETSGGYARGLGSELVPGVKNGISNVTQPNIRPSSLNAIVKIDVPEHADAFQCRIELDLGRKRTGTVFGPDGKPLDGAHFVVGWKGDRWFGDKPLDGAQFTVEELAPGPSRTLIFVHEARKLIGTIEASGDGDEPLEVRLQPWAGVRGRMVDDDGRPRSDLLMVSQDLRLQQKPDNDGRFAFDQLLPGVKYTFGSKFGEAVTAWQVREVVLQPGEFRDVGDVVVDRAKDKPGASPMDTHKSKVTVLRGRVLLPDGKPAVGANLYWAQIESSRPRSQRKLTDRGPTDKQGRFEIALTESDLPATPSPLSLVAHKAGFGIDWVHVDRNGIPTEVTLRLVDDRPIRGRVSDTEGRAVAGARVTVNNVLASSDGSLNAFLLAWRHDWRVAWTKLDRPGALYAPLGRLMGASTDGDGQFTISGVGVERLADVDIIAPGYACDQLQVVNREGFDARPYNEVALSGPVPRPPVRYRGMLPHLTGPQVTHILGAELVIHGKVFSGDDRAPVVGAIVNLDSFGYAPIVSAMTDAAGHYELRGQPRDLPLLLSAGGPEGSGFLDRSVQREAAPTEKSLVIDVELNRGILVTGRVLDRATGKGVQAYLRYVPLPGNTCDPTNHNDPTTMSDDRGAFRMFVMPGQGVLMAQVDDGPTIYGKQINPYRQASFSRQDSQRVPTTVDGDSRFFTDRDNSCNFLMAENAVKFLDLPPDGGPVTCDLPVDPGKVGKIEIDDDRGQPVTGAFIAGYADTEPTILRISQATCTIYGLGADRPRRVCVLHPERRLAAALTLAGDEQWPVKVRLAASASIRGRALAPDGQPLADALVQINYDRRSADAIDDALNLERPPLKTDADGRFALDNIIPGERFALDFKQGDTFFRAPVIPLVWDKRTLNVGQKLDLGEVKVK